MSWLKVRTTAELRTTARSPSATLALTASGAVNARRTSPAATSTRTMGSTHQRRRNVPPNPPHVRPPAGLLVTPVGRRLELTMDLVDRVAQHLTAPFTDANVPG